VNIDIDRVLVAPVTSIAHNMHRLCEAVADLATQSFIGISNGIYNDVGRELRKGLINVAKRYALATDVDAALRELQSFVDLDRLALLLVWL